MGLLREPLTELSSAVLALHSSSRRAADVRTSAYARNQGVLGSLFITARLHARSGVAYGVLTAIPERGELDVGCIGRPVGFRGISRMYAGAWQ